MTAADELERLQAERLHAHRLLPPRPLRDARGASAFVRDRKIVMASGRSSLPVLTEAIAGRAIRGSWMADPEVHRIHDVWYALDERHELFTAPIVSGKRVLLAPELGPSVARIATDERRVEGAWRRLSPLARRLLADVESRDAVRLDEWNARSRESRAARLDLARELLVTSETIHTPEGHHAAVVRPWRQSEIARRCRAEGERLSYQEATETLMLAAVRSAVVVAAREALKWFAFGAEPLERLIDAGRIERRDVGRTSWLAAG